MTNRLVGSDKSVVGSDKSVIGSDKLLSVMCCVLYFPAAAIQSNNTYVPTS
jgi:hypothetical protein